LSRSRAREPYLCNYHFFNANDTWLFSKFEFFIHSGIKDFFSSARLNTDRKQRGRETGRFEERIVLILSFSGAWDLIKDIKRN